MFCFSIREADLPAKSRRYSPLDNSSVAPDEKVDASDSSLIPTSGYRPFRTNYFDDVYYISYAAGRRA